MNSETVIRLDDRKVKMVERIQLLQDAASAVALIPAGIARLRLGGVHTLFGIVELAAVGVLSFMAARELRSHDTEERSVSWTNLIVGAILIAESIAATQAGGKTLRPALVTGMTSIFLGVFQNRLWQRRMALRAVRISDSRIHIRLSKWRQFDASWSDIARVTDDGKYVRIERQGRRPFNIRISRYGNADEIREAVATHAAAHSVPVSRTALHA